MWVGISGKQLPQAAEAHARRRRVFEALYEDRGGADAEKTYLFAPIAAVDVARPTAAEVFRVPAPVKDSLQNLRFFSKKASVTERATASRTVEHYGALVELLRIPYAPGGSPLAPVNLAMDAAARKLREGGRSAVEMLRESDEQNAVPSGRAPASRRADGSWRAAFAGRRCPRHYRVVGAYRETASGCLSCDDNDTLSEIEEAVSCADASACGSALKHRSVPHTGAATSSEQLRRDARASPISRRHRSSSICEIESRNPWYTLREVLETGGRRQVDSSCNAPASGRRLASNARIYMPRAYGRGGRHRAQANQADRNFRHNQKVCSRLRGGVYYRRPSSSSYRREILRRWSPAYMRTEVVGLRVRAAAAAVAKKVKAHRVYGPLHRPADTPYIQSPSVQL
ncbi:unnamed protein product [Rangifer tarandus platyrhynchus]|uniref:Uncharacterized protein n=1 Tax=Rangifer tarandus platyrhynchus TaxID=3082113 RepID=A0ABN8XIT5_RANTA|nr:unnamed protein product [Rangifer tarandus platyrhynchus]